LTYDVELRQGVTFHHGDPFTAEDVQFSFARYKGAGAAELKKQVRPSSWSMRTTSGLCSMSLGRIF
jgi:ABC-type transport system substrate-binding protein